jgi:hypothetical protein
MERQEKKSWLPPSLDILPIHETAAGPGIKILDDFQNDPDEPDHYS